MDRTETAVARFREGFSCSQAVFSTFAEELGLDRLLALKLATGFGGGMGRTAQTCGAVTGAVMVIGLKHGGTAADDRQAKEKTYGLVREFLAQFAARHGSTVCKDLLGCDISTAQGFDQAREQNLITTRCPDFVRSAAEILQAIL